MHHPSSPQKRALYSGLSPEAGATVSSLLDIFERSRIESVLWVVTDERCCLLGQLGFFMEEGGPPPVACGSILDSAEYAFAPSLNKGTLCRSRTQGWTSLALPLNFGAGVLGSAGCLLSQESVRQGYIPLVSSLLAAAVSACEHMLQAQQSVRELSLLKQCVQLSLEKEPRIVIDPTGIIRYVTPLAEQVVHRSKGDLIGRKLGTLLDRNVLDQLLLESSEAHHPPLPALFDSRAEHPVSVMLSAQPLWDAVHSKEILGWSILLGRELSAAKRVRDVGDFCAKYQFSDIICVDLAHKKMLSFSRLVAQSSSNILITGESGTGKELIAQSIHNASPYAGGPFVALNCSSFPPDLIETELFGYCEGAFTGARKGGYSGKVVQAHNGTLFLDEIGDMPFLLQSKLLRVLQERTVSPIGGTAVIPVQIRIVAATNQHLETLIEEKKFRADLYYRLNVVRITMLPLRERKADILPLAHYFIGVYSGKRGYSVRGFTPEAERLLYEYSWPGNVRELENAVECAVTLAKGALIEQMELPDWLQKRQAFSESVAALKSPSELSMEHYEIEQILRALERCSGNISDAARMLRIGRTTLYRKLKKFNLEKKVQYKG